MMAGSNTVSDGSFYVSNYNSKTPTGNLKVMGGIIQKARGAVGTFSGSTIQTGYAKDYVGTPPAGGQPAALLPHHRWLRPHLVA